MMDAMDAAKPDFGGIRAMVPVHACKLTG